MREAALGQGRSEGCVPRGEMNGADRLRAESGYMAVTWSQKRKRVTGEIACNPLNSLVGRE